MKYLAEGRFPDGRLLKLVLSLALFYLAVHWVTGTLLYAVGPGFTYESVTVYYRGDALGFKNPASFQVLLEESHFHLFAVGFALLFLNHLAVFTRIRRGLKFALITVSFASGLLDTASSWLVRFSSPSFAYLKIAAFGVFHLTLLVLLTVSLSALLVYDRGRSRGDGRGARHGAPRGTD
jgi:hypothetical protein